MTIWLLKDYENSEWVKQYVIDFEEIHGIGVRPVTIDDGRILFYRGQGARVYYDPPTGSFVKHEQIADADVEVAAPYTESLIWPWPRSCRVEYSVPGDI